MRLRSWAKSRLEKVFGGVIARRAGTMVRRRSALVLAYHNVVDPSSIRGGDRGLHLPLDGFRRQMDLLHARGSTVSLDALLAGTGRPEPRIAITFDDAYLGTVALALPELRARGLPATIFVAPGLLGRPSTWWDAYFDAHAGGSWRDRAIDEWSGDDAVVRAHAERERWPEAKSPAFHIAEESDLLREAELGQVSLAAHSWSHPNLARVDDGRLKEELDRSLEWLRSKSGAAQPWLAFPYGRYDARVLDAARAAGYRACFRIDGGWHREAANAYLVPRYNVSAGLSLDGFAARINGALPT